MDVIIEKYIPFVKEQIALQEKMITKFADQAWRQNLHIASLEKYKSLEKDILEISNYIKELEKRPKISVSANKLTLTFEDIQNLPKELIEELSISDADRTEFNINSIIEDNGGIASLDQILVGLYNKTNEIFKRVTITSRLHRMANKGLVFSVPGKKGIYSNHELSETDVDSLFNKEEKSTALAFDGEKVVSLA